jgi:hypothetical protein
LPKFDEFEQPRVIWGDVVILPDKAVEHMHMIGHAVEKFGRGQAISFQHQFGFFMYGFSPVRKALEK